MKGKKLKTARRHGAGYWIMFIIMTLGAVAMIFPTIWMILCSFKTQNEMYQMPPTFFPKQFNFDNFKAVFKQMPFGRYYLNSLGTGVINTLVGVFTSCILGYVFAKYQFPGRDAIFLVVLACMMIPYETLMPTVYKLQVKLGWTNTYLVLTIPYFCNIFGIFLMRQFFVDLPNDYLEAAEIDGCGQFRTWWSVAMPMAKSMISTLVIFLFMGTYNSFLWPLISVNSRTLMTLPVGLESMLSDRGSQYSMLMAASTMVIVPVCVVFAVMQKQFIEGMTAGGIKG